tara:strand:+ start:169 stop:471 length:303 start_codon:yes stop_codon:yes gene_type:complete
MADDINIIQAIVAINPEAQATVEDNDYDKITWTTGTTPISKAELQAKVAELQTEYDKNKYQRDRAVEYPSIKDQLDDLYHNGIDGWKSNIKKIKDKYPKE